MQISNTPVLPTHQTHDVEMLGISGGDAEDVAKAFEAVFASMLLKEMRKTLSDGLFGSESSDVFGGLFDQHMGDAMTNGRGLGIKQLVLSQYQSQSQADDSHSSNSMGDAQ